MAEPNWLENGLTHIWLPYTQMKTAPRPAAVRATQGSRIILDDGRQLVDGVSSWWTAIHGYNPPELLDAVAAQLARMPHVMLGGLAHEQAYRLATRLAGLAPGDLSRVFFSESGSVAVEVALKLAVQYFRNLEGKARPRFVAFRGGYHGDTFATMAICDPEEGMHALFAGALPRQHVVPLPRDATSAATLDRLLREDAEIAALIVEPLLQGAGGMKTHDAATLKRMRELCDAHGVLLIFDEIFTGFGRTGSLFAAEAAGVVPDLMCLGKALTGGVTPLAATLASERVYRAFHDDHPDKALMHGPTYSGHALACAAANASIDLFENAGRLAEVAAIEARLADAFAPLRGRHGVADVRVLGAVGAVELARDFDVEASRRAFIERGVFVRPLGRVIYLAPAYTIDPSDLNHLTDAVCAMVAQLTK